MVLGKPNTKCPHGIFKGGESTARYCSFCNPTMTLSAVVSRTHAIPDVEVESEDVLDCYQFIEQDAGRRIGR